MTGLARKCEHSPSLGLLGVEGPRAVGVSKNELAAGHEVVTRQHKNLGKMVVSEQRVYRRGWGQGW